MQKRISITIFLIILFTSVCCHRLQVTNPDFENLKTETLVEMIHTDMMDALRDPSFLEQSKFEIKWKEKTINWNRLLVQLETKAAAAGNTQLANNAADLNATVSQLPESVERFRKRRLTTLKDGVERLKKAL